MKDLMMNISQQAAQQHDRMIAECLEKLTKLGFVDKSPTIQKRNLDRFLATIKPLSIKQSSDDIAVVTPEGEPLIGFRFEREMNVEKGKFIIKAIPFTKFENLKEEKQ